MKLKQIVSPNTKSDSKNSFSAFWLFLVILLSPLFATEFANSQNAPALSSPEELSESNLEALQRAVNSNLRIDKGRDIYRHPLETLSFFGIKPNYKVIEVWPGSGWYSTILAPYLKSGGGSLIAAQLDTNYDNSPAVTKLVENYQNRFLNNYQMYGNVSIVGFGPLSGPLAEDNSVDAVLTFRNIHNWMDQSWSDKAFRDFYSALKPGGILGVVEHRANPNSPQDPTAADGYVRQDYVIELATDAGFVLVETSEINANPNDTKNHPFGVWTLPPVLRSAAFGQPDNPNFDHSPYLAIGESDRMTLVFRKPFGKSNSGANNANSKEAKPESKPFFNFFNRNKNKKPETAPPAPKEKAPVTQMEGQNNNSGLPKFSVPPNNAAVTQTSESVLDEANITDSVAKTAVAKNIEFTSASPKVKASEQAKKKANVKETTSKKNSKNKKEQANNKKGKKSSAKKAASKKISSKKPASKKPTSKKSSGKSKSSDGPSWDFSKKKKKN